MKNIRRKFWAVFVALNYVDILLYLIIYLMNGVENEGKSWSNSLTWLQIVYRMLAPVLI